MHLYNKPVGVFQNSREEKLIKACLRGDRKSQSAIYEMHKVYLFGVCMRYGKNRIEAEDMLQEAFYKIFRDLKQYKRNSPFKFWLRKITVNTALMHIRKYRKLQISGTEVDFEMQGEYDTELLELDRAQAIIHLVRQLPAIQQTVFNLRGIDGYAFAEIEEMIGVKEATVRSHYLRARKALQVLLKKELN